MLNLFYSLLKTEEGQLELENGGKILGIEINVSTWNNIINYNNIEIKTLELKNKIPYGYEEDEEYSNNNKTNIYIIKHNLNVKIQLKENFPEFYILKSYNFIPNCEENKFIFKLYNLDGEDGVGTECISGESTSFELELNVQSDYQGYINRWMILSFEGVQQHSQLSSTTSTCYLAVRISGNVLNESHEKILKSLNVDAAPFIPQIAKSYFDDDEVIIIIFLFLFSSSCFL